MLRLYFSQFFASFFIGLRRIYSRTDVRNLITDICSLLAADLILWLINWNFIKSYISFDQKQAVLYSI